HRVPGRAFEPTRAQRLHTATEVADPRQHDSGRALDLLDVGSQRRVATHALQRLLGRTQIAEAVVEDRDPHYRTPLVDGTDEPSTRTASRRHRATPLNDASRTWWGFLPLIWRMCRVTPALVANALQNSSASCGSNGGFPNGSGAGDASY